MKSKAELTYATFGFLIFENLLREIKCSGLDKSEDLRIWLKVTVKDTVLEFT